MNTAPTTANASPRVEFLFDIGSPNAYLCHRVLPAFEARTGAAVVYAPILLGGLFKLANNRSPIVAYAEIPHKLAYERLEIERFVRRHRLARFRMNPHFPVNTLPTMRVVVAAQDSGCGAAATEALFAAMWEDGRNLGDAAELAAVLAAAGLDAAALLARAQLPETKARLQAQTQAAYDRGAFGAPTFFVDGEAMYFGKDRLDEVERAVAQPPVPHAQGRPA